MFLIFAGISWIVIVKSVSQSVRQQISQIFFRSFSPSVSPSVSESVSRSQVFSHPSSESGSNLSVRLAVWSFPRSVAIGRTANQSYGSQCVQIKYTYFYIFFSLYQTDVHLHCEEWDRLLDEGDWEPQEIVAKLPTFLQFLRQVQRNVAPQAMAGGE